MELLGRDSILDASDIQTDLVEVPEWAGTVRVRGLSGAERDNYEGSLTTTRGRDVKMNWRNARAKLVALTVVNEGGERVFADIDVAALGKKSGAALDRIFKVARRLSGLTNEDVEELVEGFGEAPNDASSLA